MLWNLDLIWLVMAFATVTVLSFFFGSALDALIRDDGFGSNGNMVILCGGFFLAILAANYQGYNLHELHRAILTGLAGAFILMSVFTLLKAGISRL